MSLLRLFRRVFFFSFCSWILQHFIFIWKLKCSAPCLYQPSATEQGKATLTWIKIKKKKKKQSRGAVTLFVLCFKECADFISASKCPDPAQCSSFTYIWGSRHVSLGSGWTSCVWLQQSHELLSWFPFCLKKKHKMIHCPMSHHALHAFCIRPLPVLGTQQHWQLTRMCGISAQRSLLSATARVTHRDHSWFVSVVWC